MREGISLPAAYLAMPRWWHGDRAWLEALPAQVETACARWNLAIEGEPWHGSNALVVPVWRGNEALALRLTPPDADTAAEVRALRFWNGHGVVRLVEADVVAGWSLLERFDGAVTLATRPLAEAIPVLGGLIRTLAIPAPEDVPHTNVIIQTRLAELPGAWDRLGQPFPREVLDGALVAGARIGSSSSTLAVNGDLHAEQVLKATRAPWLVVDPRLMRGKVGYDLARALWTRLDEMEDAAAIRHWLGVLAEAAGIPLAHATDCVVYRTVDYWLWGLSYGLTEDPVRCARLLAAIHEGNA